MFIFISKEKKRSNMNKLHFWHCYKKYVIEIVPILFRDIQLSICGSFQNAASSCLSSACWLHGFALFLLNFPFTFCSMFVYTYACIPVRRAFLLPLKNLKVYTCEWAFSFARRQLPPLNPLDFGLIVNSCCRIFGIFLPTMTRKIRFGNYIGII